MVSRRDILKGVIAGSVMAPVFSSGKEIPAVTEEFKFKKKPNFDIYTKPEDQAIDLSQVIDYHLEQNTTHRMILTDNFSGTMDQPSFVFVQDGPFINISLYEERWLFDHLTSHLPINVFHWKDGQKIIDATMYPDEVSLYSDGPTSRIIIDVHGKLYDGR